MTLRIETKVYCGPFYTLACGFSDPTAPHGDFSDPILPTVTALSTALRVDWEGRVWKSTAIRRLCNEFLHATATHSDALYFMILGLTVCAGLSTTVLLLPAGIPRDSGHQ